MNLPQNISKSFRRKGIYVGHCNGAQIIQRGGQGWQTVRLGSAAGKFTYATARTLKELGAKLDALNGK